MFCLTWVSDVKPPVRVGFLVLALFVSACSPAEDEKRSVSVLDRADVFAQTVLEGYNEGDYAKFSRHFGSPLKRQLSERVFHTLRDSMIVLVGRYQLKRVDRVEKDGDFQVVYYRVRFDNESGSLVKIVLQPYWDDYLISGIEFAGNPDPSP